MGGGIHDGTYPQDDKFLKAAVSMSDEYNGVLDLVRHSGLTAIAEECRRLARARGRYSEGRYPWTIDDGSRQMRKAIDEWEIECMNCMNPSTKDQVEEYGDILHTVLSIGAHMGYDIEQALRDAMQRNAGTGEEGRVMRLHELTEGQLTEWRVARMDAGRSKYGNAHMHRYGCVDIAEELQDARNIAMLTGARVYRQLDDPGVKLQAIRLLRIFADRMDEAMALLQEIDVLLPDEVCSDEQGGERIWISEQGRGGGDE